MKYNIVSDLHLEFGTDVKLPGGDVLLLAGDIGLASDSYTYMDWLEAACKQYTEVVMIMGNHEHYHGDFLRSYTQIKEATKDIENYVLLENESHLTQDGTLILGCTLWSDIDPQYEAIINSQMNDYIIVKNLSTAVSRTRHKHSVRWLTDQLKNSEGLEKVIVMTHMSPTMKAPEEYRGNYLNSAYGTDLTKLILEWQPSIWIHGHTHTSMSYKVGDTPIRCNPRGYQGHALNPEFNPDFTVEV